MELTGELLRLPLYTYNVQANFPYQFSISQNIVSSCEIRINCSHLIDCLKYVIQVEQSYRDSQFITEIRNNSALKHKVKNYSD